jgi:hypothetical protein
MAVTPMDKSPFDFILHMCNDVELAETTEVTPDGEI